jgi:hypothetical protein
MAASVPVVPMDRGNNTTCTINLHGATIVSWRVNNQVGPNRRSEAASAGPDRRMKLYKERGGGPVVKMGIKAS